MQYTVRWVEDFPWEGVQFKLLPDNPAYDRKGRTLRGKWGLMDALKRHTAPETLEPLIEDLRRRPMIEPAQINALPEGDFIHFGLSRLQACHAIKDRYGERVKMKAIVADYHDCGRYNDYPVLGTQEAILGKFTSAPYQFLMGQHWLVIHNCRDWHLEERLNIHHPSWEQAQRGYASWAPGQQRRCFSWDQYPYE